MDRYTTFDINSYYLQLGQSCILSYDAPIPTLSDPKQAQTFEREIAITDNEYGRKFRQLFWEGGGHVRSFRGG